MSYSGLDHGCTPSATQPAQPPESCARSATVACSHSEPALPLWVLKCLKAATRSSRVFGPSARRSRVTRGVTTIDRARDRPFAGGRDRRLFLCRRRLIAGIMQRGYCRDSVIARGRTDCRSPRAYAPGHIVRFACHGYAELMNGNGPIKYCGSVSIEPASGYTTIGALPIVEPGHRASGRCYGAPRGRIRANSASYNPSRERKAHCAARAVRHRDASMRQ